MGAFNREKLTQSKRDIPALVDPLIISKSRGLIPKVPQKIAKSLTEYDRARQTFFLVKFLPPHFFLEIILGLWAKVGGSEKIPPAGPLGGQGGPKGLGPPKWGICHF